MYYTVHEVFINEQGSIKEAIVKSTMDQSAANSFIEIARELKPKSKFYMTTEGGE